jgi:hypothetical protein
MQVRECAEDFVGAQEGQSWQKQAAGETLDSDSRGPRSTVTVPFVSGLRYSLRRIFGGPSPTVDPEFNWPPVLIVAILRWPALMIGERNQNASACASYLGRACISSFASWALWPIGRFAHQKFSRLKISFQKVNFAFTTTFLG